MPRYEQTIVVKFYADEDEAQTIAEDIEESVRTSAPGAYVKAYDIAIERPPRRPEE